MSRKSKTKFEKDHMNRVAQLGCIACSEFHGVETPEVELHHITTRRGLGQRSKHTEVLPLCFNHHRGGNAGVAIHSGVKTWEERYDTQENLLIIVEERLKEFN